MGEYKTIADKLYQEYMEETAAVMNGKRRSKPPPVPIIKKFEKAQSRKEMSRSVSRKHGSWYNVRENVLYLGCFSDYANIHPEYEDDKNYFTGDKSKFKPLIPLDQRLPKVRDYTKHYFDGPSRIIPSIESIFTPDEDPRQLPLDQALKRCYDMAKSKNKKYFALQNGGLCFATNSKDFMQWNQLNPAACKTCLKECTSHGKPCGKTCTKKHRSCHKIEHATCAHNDTNNLNKSNKAGGYFTNSVFEIKDMEYGDDKYSKYAVPDDEKAINDAFRAYSYPPIEVGDKMKCERAENNFFDLSPTQLYLQQYFTPNNPVKGMLSYGSAGSGKTCQALNVIGNFMSDPATNREGWRICWVTRQSLTSTPVKNLYEDICMERLRRIIDSEEPITLASGEVLASDKKEKIDFIRSTRAPAVLKRYGIELDMQFIITYDMLVKMILGKGSQGRKLRDMQLARDPKHQDIGYQTFFCFDEAHNLITPGLPAEERKEMDREFSEVKVSGKQYKSLKDIYGNISGLDRKMQGRDLIAAMLYRSYELSKADSAKLLLLTATPMSTSPTDLFWLMNLMLEPRLRLSLNLDDYYDKSTMRLKDEAVIKFAAAAHGRIAYFDTTQDVTKFAKKVFAAKKTSVLHRFHQRIIDEAVEKEMKSKKAKDPSRFVSLFNNLSLCARVKGPFFQPAVIEEYEANMERWKNWDSDKEAKYQKELYDREIPQVKKLFGFLPTAIEEKAYDKKLKQYQTWVKKNGPVPHKLPELDGIVDDQGNLKSFEEWTRVPEQSESKIEVSPPVMKKYEKLLEKYKEFQKQVQLFEKKKIPKRPRKPQLENLLKSDGVNVKSLEEFAISEEPVKLRDRVEYDKLKQAFSQFKGDLSQYNKLSKQSIGFHVQPPTAIGDIMDDSGQLLSLTDWANKTKKNKKANKKKYTNEETKYLKYLIRDPATGFMRLKTREEFVEVRMGPPTLDGVETRKDVNFMLTSKQFKPDAVRQLLPYYAPRLYQCIQDIIAIEKYAQATFGHGFKHTVFTFSVAGKGDYSSTYGSRILASAFHAFPELFRVLLVYEIKKVKNKEGKSISYRILRSDVPKKNDQDHRWGVAVLSSRGFDNIYHKKYGGNKNIEYNTQIVKATQKAFNDAQNRYGDQIKVMIMDGAYVEGVEGYDAAVSHFLTPGVSRSQLEQAAARGVRACNSNNIPYFAGVGGINEMYFYDNTMPDGRESLNDQMFKHIPYDDQLKLNMMDVFQEMARNFSVDYWLNYNINNFNPVQKGKITDFYPDYQRSYMVVQELEFSKKDKLDYDFIVDPDNMLTPMAVNSLVVDEAGRYGKIVKMDEKTGGISVKYDESGQVSEKLKKDLRFQPGQIVNYHIPYGVDLAQKVMNIGNYNVMHPSEMIEDMVQNINIPLNALNVLKTSFRNDMVYTLLGFVSMLRLLNKNLEVPVHIVLPDETSGEEMPGMDSMSLQWSCEKDGKTRILRSKPGLLESFLAPEKGISIILLFLNSVKCGSVHGAETVHTNVLLYVPEWKTVERFDPLGFIAHPYDSVELDSRLYELFEGINPEIRYMSSSETLPLVGLQRLQMQEDEKDAESYRTVFSIFYMHMRILYAATALKEYPMEKKEVFPLQFQRGLLKAIKTKVPGKLNQFSRDYAELIVQSRPMVVEWKKYDEDLPFWVNCVRMIKSLCKPGFEVPNVPPSASKRMSYVPETPKVEEVRQERIWDSLKKLLWSMPLV